MQIAKIIGIIIVLVILAASIAVTVVSNLDIEHYSGKVVFNTEEEYTQFKEVIAQESVSYDADSISVLSSSPPIVVNFKNIQAPNDFPYGEGTTLLYKINAILTLIAICLGIVVVIYFM